jgi:hypothetical protein
MSNYYGQQDGGSGSNDFNELAFVVQRLLARIRTIDMVTVISCTNAGTVTPVGMVTVQVLTNQMTGGRTPIAHGSIYNVPYLRIQGGVNAVIMDPQAGDMGMCGFCSRDISAVKTALQQLAGGSAPSGTKPQQNPGSYRMFDWADGLYLGGFLNAVPTQYVQFAAGTGGVNIVSPNQITLSAPNVTIAASTKLTVTSPEQDNSGKIVAQGEVTANGTTNLHTHIHSGVQTGSGDTGPPTV